jgi:hypothetical protein
MAGFYEWDNEPSDSIKARNSLINYETVSFSR